MKKLSTITESLWKKGIERSKSGDERLENKNTSKNKAEEFMYLVYDTSEDIGVPNDYTYTLWEDFTQSVMGGYSVDWEFGDILDNYDSYDEFLDACQKWLDNVDLHDYDIDKLDFQDILG